MRAKLPAILAIVTTGIGLISSPAVAGLFDAKTAGIIIAVGSLWQAITNPVHK